VARAGISGLAVTIGAAGLYLVYAGIRGVPFVDGLRELAAGKLPAGTPPKIVGKGVARQTDLGTPSASGLIRPLAGAIGDGFGAPRPGRTHKGIDIAAAEGTPIVAAASGAVVGRGYDVGAGNYVNLKHANGLTTKYFHLSRFAVGMATPVTQGQVIGYVGHTGNASGPHLHFEVWEGGQARDPLNYLPG
jgi:murein DD-endopeptidase MepM/ murein hydrolase activator NlpD